MKEFYSLFSPYFSSYSIVPDHPVYVRNWMIDFKQVSACKVHVIYSEFIYTVYNIIANRLGE